MFNFFHTEENSSTLSIVPRKSAVKTRYVGRQGRVLKSDKPGPKSAGMSYSTLLYTVHVNVLT